MRGDDDRARRVGQSDQQRAIIAALLGQPNALAGFATAPTRFLFFTGKGGVGKTSLSTATALTLAVVLARRWEPSTLVGRSWAPLLLAVGASGGLGRVFDETGMAELLAEYALHPRHGVLTPFLAAAIVKTMQGNSLTAVLTASGWLDGRMPRDIFYLGQFLFRSQLAIQYP